MQLQYKVTLLVFGIILATGIVGGAIVLHLQRQAAVSQFSESTIVLASALRDSIERDMLLYDREHIQKSVMLIGSRAPVTDVTILSADRKVFASADPAAIGQVRDSDQLAWALASGITVSSSGNRYGRNSLSMVFPLLNKPACHGCHGSAKPVLGALEIGWETKSLDDQIREQTTAMLLIGGLALMVMGVSLSLMLRSAVVNPLAKLAASAHRIAHGDFTARVEFRDKNEVGTVGRAFNEMAQWVQKRTEQLQQLVTVRGELLDRLISVQEEERRRIARELHDEVGQVLSGIMLDLSRTIYALPEGAVAARERLCQSRALAAQSLAELRKVIYDLRPEVLDQLGLVPALRSYVESRLKVQNIRAHLRFDGMEDRLLPRTEITLFRVIQEAVTNIIRHSQATMVSIKVAALDSVVFATIEDNGRGFDVQATLQASESWGLRGIRERAAVVNGELTIESEVGRGTRIQLRIPLQQGVE